MKKPGTILINKINIDGCTDHGDDNKSTIGSPISGFIHRFEYKIKKMSNVIETQETQETQETKETQETQETQGSTSGLILILALLFSVLVLVSVLVSVLVMVLFVQN
jgi:hypothetical protein